MTTTMHLTCRDCGVSISYRTDDNWWDVERVQALLSKDGWEINEHGPTCTACHL